ncbi:MAG TPA: hypothetical protein VGV37_06310 [Aliidongia sp.]|uniref:hypothetical protein n=1 Tax=Aliidongia sp. TaxID=1914230 RepID=UPI002DDCDA90|nr:hypothetical protein [Aliidongia sp.]HEV2674138.1 hypothetical protein [Aliidongia sp.]
MNPMIVGTLLYGALYLAAVFVAALATGKHAAMDLCLFAMVVTYLSFLAQIEPTDDIITARVRFGIVLASLCAGLAAGLALL